ncbi:MAG: M23 family metallopeptidase [Spirochaetaceae bacterium]|jgi:murein DD-endopeptidase MepM/ murein hydrolase activator NlpD|nr:M23 family metallopeptidase [Spirochaetaceae bacterium]
MEYLPLETRGIIQYQINRNCADLFCILLCIFIYAYPSAQSYRSYPEIQELQERRDHLFQQFSQDVEQSYKDIAKGDPLRPFLYVYKVKEGDTLMDIAARCVLSYETIATLNRISDNRTDIRGRTLLLPTVPGLFIPEKPSNDLEALLFMNRQSNSTPPEAWITVRYSGASSAVFGFYPDMKLTPTERTFFLTGGFRFPLPRAVLTSSYGIRKNPVTGTVRFHEGIDLAAPVGTNVVAARSGMVKETGYDAVYGNFIILSHDNEMESLYGHLKKVLVNRNQSVAAGYTIGEVGSTGQSTGPHLHFEIWIGGAARDPAEILQLDKKGK